MRHLRQNLSVASLVLGLAAATQAAPLVAQPVWSRSDTGIGSTVAPNGQIGQAHGGIDSAWVRILNPSGQIRWSAGWKLLSQAPSHTPSLKALVPTPDGGWIAGFDRSYTNLTNTVLYRFDSLGRSVGSPMFVYHDTALTFSVVSTGEETWAAAKVSGSRPTVVHRFGAQGTELDSLVLANSYSEFQDLFAVGKRVLVHGESAYNDFTIASFFLLGSPVSDPGGRTAILQMDTAITLGYTSKIVPKDDASFTYVTDSGSLDVVNGRYPRVRAVSWTVNGDQLLRTASATTDLVSAAHAWTAGDGTLRLIGTRRIPGALRFEPLVATLSAAGATLRAKAIQPDAGVTNTLTTVFGADHPDGSAFVGVMRLDRTVAITLLDKTGDSLRTLDVAPQGTVGLWYAQPDGSILSQRHSSGGDAIILEDWNTSPTAAIFERTTACKSLRTAGTDLILDLDQPSRQARLDVVDLRGRLLSSRDLGSLEAGRHFLTPNGTGARLVRLQLDGTRLIAKMLLP